VQIFHCIVLYCIAYKTLVHRLLYGAELSGLGFLVAYSEHSTTV